MKVLFDQERDIMRISLKDGEYDISRELAEGIIADVTKDKKLMALEIIDVSKRIPSVNLKEFT